MDESKAVLISIRPEWVSKILRGEKTLEVRKSRPKLEPPFRAYIYCSKGTELLWMDHGRIIQDRHYSRLLDDMPEHLLNGRVVAEFECSAIHTFTKGQSFDESTMCISLRACSCLSASDVWAYSDGGKKDLYGWHISDLKVHDNPLELSEFTPLCRSMNDEGNCKFISKACQYQHFDMNFDGPVTLDTYRCALNCVICTKRLTRPPQSWCYVKEGLE